MECPRCGEVMLQDGEPDDMEYCCPTCIREDDEEYAKRDRDDLSVEFP